MTDLLTTKQLQDVLKIDRTTVYRMLKDGRLTGVKVGHQWRFSLQKVEALLAQTTPPSSETASPLGSAGVTPFIPLDCVESVQKVFAEVAGVGAITTAPDGQPLTQISNSCHFCNLIQSSESGRQGCIASWRKLAGQSEHRPKFATCHAGLQYARARIEVNGQLQGLLIAGQFYAQPPDPAAETARIQRLAETYHLDEAALLAAAQELPVLESRKLEHLGDWLQSVAATFEKLGRERADLVGRLHHIAQVSTLNSA